MTDRPLHGRQRECERFTDLLASRTFRGVVLSGVPGVGKTRLSEALLEIGRSRGYNTVLLRCGPGTMDLPLSVFAPFLPTDTFAIEGLPMLLQARQALVARIAGRPSILGVDDVQYLDGLSAMLVNQLVTSGQVLVVLSYRAGEFVPEPVAKLWHEGLIERWDIAPLDRDATLALAESLSAQRLDPASGTSVWKLSGGNPLFVREVVAGATEAGGLGVVGSSGRLIDFVDIRLANLSDAARDALTVVALTVVALAEPVGLDDVERLTSLDALTELEEGGVIDVQVDRRRTVVRLLHPLYGEVVRARTSRLRARGVYRDLARILEEHGARRREDLLRVASWSIDGGWSVATELLIEAAERARFANVFLLAERLARAAFDREPSYQAGRVLSSAYYELGRHEENEALLDEMEPMATDDEAIAVVWMARAVNRFWRAADLPGALAAIDEGLARVSDPLWSAEIAATRATILAFSGEATTALETALPIANGFPGRAHIQAALAAGAALMQLGRPDESLDLFARAMAVYEQLGEQLTLITSRVVQTLTPRIKVMTGQFTAATEEAVALRDRALAENDEATQSLACLALAWALLLQGRCVESYPYWDEADSLLRQRHHPGMRRWSLIGMAVAAAQVGDRERLGRAEDQLAAIGPQPARIWDGVLPFARALVAGADGDRDRARAILVAAADDARGRAAVFDEGGALYLLARLGYPEDSRDRLGELAVEHGALVGAWYLHAHALASRQRAAADEALDALLALPDWPVAAELARWCASTFGAPAAYLPIARRCEERIGDATAGERYHAAATPLTRREREIAELAAGGLASRAIAERLFLSTRTVDNHLGRVYDKLGVSSRSELIDALARAS